MVVVGRGVGIGIMVLENRFFYRFGIGFIYFFGLVFFLVVFFWVCSCFVGRGGEVIYF